MNTRSSFWFAYYWGADIQLFHANMRKDWRELKCGVVNETYLLDEYGDPGYLESTAPILVYEEHKEMIIQPHRITVTHLGPSPRTRFPLLLVFFINDDDLHTPLRDTDTVALFAVIHVKDKYCTMDSNFLFKLNKMANNQVQLPLTPPFLSEFHPQFPLF